MSDIAKEKEEYRLNETLNKSLSQDNVSYQVSGPFEKYPNDFSAIEAASEIWYRSSFQMKALCRENGIRYIHLSSQTICTGSKPMGQQERLIAIQEGPYIYKDLVVSGYPMLMNRGAKLRSQGVEFYDLSMVFKDNAEVIYSDSLCHINKLGNDFMAK